MTKRSRASLCRPSRCGRSSSLNDAVASLEEEIKEISRMSLNTDNRLMSGVSVSDEYAVAVDAFGLSRADLGEITRPWQVPDRRPRDSRESGNA